MVRVLTAATGATCPHGGLVVFVPEQHRATASGAPVLTTASTAVVVGCPNAAGGVPNPCTTVSWATPSARVTAGSSPLLLETSVGTCLDAMSAPQGQMVLTDVQSRVHAV